MWRLMKFNSLDRVTMRPIAAYLDAISKPLQVRAAFGFAWITKSAGVLWAPALSVTFTLPALRRSHLCRTAADTRRFDGAGHANVAAFDCCVVHAARVLVAATVGTGAVQAILRLHVCADGKAGFSNIISCLSRPRYDTCT